MVVIFKTNKYNILLNIYNNNDVNGSGVVDNSTYYTSI